MSFAKWSLLGVFACSAIAGANAALVERTVQLPIRTLDLPTSDLLTVLAVDPFTVDVGDTLVFHLDFVGGRLAMTDSGPGLNDYIGLQFLSNPVGQTGFLFTGTWHLEGVGGELLINDFALSYGGPIGGSTSNINLTDSSFSITGITLSVAVLSKEAGRPAFSADAVEFHAYTGGRPEDAISVRSVPEPSSFALIAIALAGAATVGRRRAQPIQEPIA